MLRMDRYQKRDGGDGEINRNGCQDIPALRRELVCADKQGQRIVSILFPYVIFIRHIFAETLENNGLYTNRTSAKSVMSVNP